MATRQPAPLSYVLRTSSMRSEYKGGHEEGLEVLFTSLPGWQARFNMLEKLQEAHLRATEYENAKAKEEAEARK